MAWTEITRQQYRREGLRYASDLTDEEWALIEPMMPPPAPVGRPRTTQLRSVMNAILYMASTGCQWRQLPKDFPPYSTVQSYFYAWSRERRFATINHALVMAARESAGREASPTAGVIDSQSVKTTESGGPRGFDAGKKVKGRKRHIVTDTQGNLVGLVVHPADIQDRDGAPIVSASVRKGHEYRIVVSDLVRKRPIWFGGADRSEASMAQCYQWLGAKSRRLRLAVMDMGKPFRNATNAYAPQAAILFDKFHIIRHLGEALDQVRKSEYARLSGKQRRYIKGQKYTLLSRKENLTLEGRQALRTLLRANKRLNTAYLLKETFGQLWSYEHEGWARRFFENWRASLKWQRLKPYEKFADMIDRHWDGIAAYCRPENKVSLGFVEGFNNKIRLIQRRAYGLRDEEYLRLKILTCMLPML